MHYEYSFGGNKRDFPCPQTHRDQFKDYIRQCNEREAGVWDPTEKRVCEWLDMNRV